MDNESVRNYCLSFPHVTETVQWGADLVFKIGGKMFAVIGLDPASDHSMSFKTTPENFAELTERNGIVPAPYVARYHWVALARFDVLSERELKALLRLAYDLVFEKLPKKVKSGLEKAATPKGSKRN
ncbi:MAG TPA: MmcQ/YjbR family DNA-binding protein [Pyrinomonadaceae bacterium]|nr:MmcQ/YjbR family DNA-binding protein [Pyrinomonadaceae bacterium]